MAKKAASDDATDDTMTADDAPSGDEAGSAEGLPDPAPRRDRPKKKTVAFDHAMQALGRDAKPLEIQAWIKARYDMLLKPTLLSTYKGNWLRKHHGDEARRPVGRPRKVTADAAPGGERDATLTDIRALQEMIGRVGRKQFQEMLSLLGVS